MCRGYSSFQKQAVLPAYEQCQPFRTDERSDRGSALSLLRSAMRCDTMPAFVGLSSTAHRQGSVQR